MSKFQPIAFYARAKAEKYKLLPFRFSALNDEKYVLSNISGEYITLEKSKLRSFVKHQLNAEDPDYINLRAKQFLLDSRNGIAPELLALKIRTRYRRLSDFTALHIFVVSLRCEHSCPYCQVSRQSEDKQTYDMSPEVAEKSLDLAFQSPSSSIKIEFQGGEPLLNFERIKQIVISATKRNKFANKNLDFVIATNLALISVEILQFCKEHQIHISTSLDGPEDIHNKNRPRPGKDSFDRATKGIELAREILGRDQVSALMTTTEISLGRVKEIIDEYLKFEFEGIFLRHLSPYGFAIKTKSYRAYTTEKWLEFYKEGLDYVIDLNRKGIPFQEYYASTVLTKMLTSDDPGFVDLMNPSGMGIAAIVYNYDGSVHPSDESRMLAEMGDNTFKLGNVLENSYEEIFSSEALLNPLETSFTLSAPMCTDCAYEPYCGADPVYHYAIHKDFVARKPESEFCKRNMEIFKHLISLMEADPFIKKLFTKWANRG
jgi:His-Xaa-Ser system radical SAM maturase HxsB